ncbi:adenosylcobinamide-phosphate synthase, partial [candidate division KSB1 bacterium]|nr:adenosylcobinamide-phosphate synthase [candidate division KSB1 bacterium]NIR70915.1 adenosylcobinamide-phosphate synthase [candidate division KSB1 bacterium]NIS23087.1 adenosylcobinamide-phosphate synthase [candidate division KSB1 bacterium]NIT69922.1 adenosylcobinamide-phosphate synthase [candidate division KSB1 bacterium]NIU23588.1 adenosylcobinamide-phosphate synthase [candidate division KSB1 bacterium]
PKDIIRGTVETIAENTVDGVISPMFFAFLGGAPFALTYKVINTLDSMIGHKNVRYRHFGKFAARLDDAANFIPARMSVPAIGFAAFLVGLNFKRTIAITFRDGGKHPSPNAGIPEAAFAGALSIQLGGLNSYQGVASPKRTLGDARLPLELIHIKKAEQLMFMTSIISLSVFSALLLLIGKFL